jgi:prepilin-type processing-associated H-X9-DG protein
MDVYICPSSKWTSTSYRPAMPNATGLFGKVVTASYTGILSLSNFNNAAGITSVWKYSGAGTTLAEVQHPSDTVVIVESSHMLVDNNARATPDGTSVVTGTGSGIGFYGFFEDGRPLPMPSNGLVGRMHYRHFQQMNVAYMDGHAKATKQFTKISDLAIR